MVKKSIGILFGTLSTGAFRNLKLDLINGLLAEGTSKIHLFYAGPTAGAIAIGREINPRMTPLIQLYEYNRADSPRYQKSIKLEENPYD